MLQKELIGQRLAFVGGGQSAERVGASTTPALAGSMLPTQAPPVPGVARPIADDVGGWLAGLKPQTAEAWDPRNIAGVNRDTDVFAPVKQARALGNTVEDWVRGTHYLTKRTQGHTPEAAREAVFKYQIDYSNLTEFERNVMKRVFPWYTFSRRSLPPLLEDLVTKPAKVAGATRLISGVREPGEFVPEWVAEGASIPIPGAPEGQSRYISSFGLPMEDELLKTVGSAAQGDYARVFQQLFGMSQPFVKLPAELATGTQMYSGRRLEDLRPYEFSRLGGLVPEDTARQVSQVVANTPLSRFGSTLDKFIDERKGIVPTVLNTATGVRVTDVETDLVKERIAQDLLQELLRGQPGVKVRENVYVPKEQLPNLDPQDALMYDLLKEIEARSSARRRAAQPR
jgi:hypothetical protein